MITAEFDQFFLVTTYVPNAGRKLVTLPKRLEWDPLLREHLVNLDRNKKKPVVLCGDLNVAHLEIDLANPKTNKKVRFTTQCGYFRIFLPLRFYVKSILGISEVQKLPF